MVTVGAGVFVRVRVGVGVAVAVADGAVVVGATLVGAAVVGVADAVRVGDALRVTVGVAEGSWSFPELLRAAHSAPAPSPRAMATITATTMGQRDPDGCSSGSSGGPEGGSCMVG